jgi:hypothetical protein
MEGIQFMPKTIRMFAADFRRWAQIKIILPE